MSYKDFKIAYYDAVKLFFKGQFGESRPFFEKALQYWKNESLTLFYLKRIEEINNTPGFIWKGYWTLDKK